MRKLLVGSGCFTLVCFLLACLGLGEMWIVEAPFNLAFGWAFFCYQTLPRVRVDVMGVVTAAVCLTVFAAGLHLFLRWLYRNMRTTQATEGASDRRWPIRWTGAIIGLIVLMFVAGLAATGIGHQTAWLMTSPQPIIESSWDTGVRGESINNLKQMTFAMFAYNQVYKSLPPAAKAIKDGQPLLSWRVRILPFLEREDLFKKYHLDEPWDSPNNLRLLPQIPRVYNSLSLKDAAQPFATHYQVFVGRGAAFEKGSELRLPDDIPDGTANTFLIVEATKAVPWTKPEDLQFEPNLPLPELGHLMPNHFLAAMADGSVTRFQRDIREETLRGLVTRNGGESLDLPKE